MSTYNFVVRVYGGLRHHSQHVCYQAALNEMFAFNNHPDRIQDGKKAYVGNIGAGGYRDQSGDEWADKKSFSDDNGNLRMGSK